MYRFLIFVAACFVLVLLYLAERYYNKNKPFVPSWLMPYYNAIKDILNPYSNTSAASTVLYKAREFLMCIKYYSKTPIRPPYERDEYKDDIIANVNNRAAVMLWAYGFAHDKLHEIPKINSITEGEPEAAAITSLRKRVFDKLTELLENKDKMNYPASFLNEIELYSTP